MVHVKFPCLMLGITFVRSLWFNVQLAFKTKAWSQWPMPSQGLQSPCRKEVPVQSEEQLFPAVRCGWVEKILWRISPPGSRCLCFMCSQPWWGIHVNQLWASAQSKVLGPSGHFILLSIVLGLLAGRPPPSNGDSTGQGRECKMLDRDPWDWNGSPTWCMQGSCWHGVDMRFRCFGSAPCFLVQVDFAVLVDVFGMVVRLWNLIHVACWNLTSKAQYRASVKRKRIDIHLLKLYQKMQLACFQISSSTQFWFLVSCLWMKFMLLPPPI